MSEYEARFCPHCGSQLEEWLGAPETGWGIILVCANNSCEFFRGSKDDILYTEEDSPLGCRYAEDPENRFESFNLLAYRGSCD